MRKQALLTALCLAMTGSAWAQLSTNPDKFLGNITTRGQVNGTGFEYADLWNQITPENESKWQSVEGTRDRYNWGGCDNAFNYAKNHNFPFKFHTLVWGSQYPTWMNNLSTQEQYDEIVEWMDAVQSRYPDLEMIDVVNEAIPGHAPAPYKEALGGDGKTGYDWIIKAFEMAAERWPNAILIYNDYNTFQWQKSEFIDLVKRLRNAGAPIDAYGCQSHDLTDMNFTDFKRAMKEIQDALQMPMYSTEYDIGTSDDQKQKKQYSDQIKYMWEQDYVAGITLWGFIYGATWTTDGNSGIIRNGQDRPAMTWLREYMATDEAKTARSPFPGMKKEASVYIKPVSLNVDVDAETPLTVNARLRTKQIDRVELYAAGELIATMTEAPYVANYTPTKVGELALKAIVYDTEGNQYERISGVNVCTPRKPFKGTPIELPGIIEAEDFDQGAEGIAFHDSNTTREGDGASYRTDTGIDVVKIPGGGYAIGYTNTGEWMEYTVNVTEAGYYNFALVASSGQEGGRISVQLSDDNGLTTLIPDLAIPVSGWDTYKTYHGRLPIQLEAGKQIIRITVANTGVNIDKLKLSHINLDENLDLALTADPSPAIVNQPTMLHADVEGDIQRVRFFANNMLIQQVETAPYEVAYTPTVTGTCTIMAEATTTDGRTSPMASMSLQVSKLRKPYGGTPAEIPGTIEFENFDVCGEGFSFHDSDSNDEGNAHYRTDNEGVDIVACTGGYAIGYTAQDEWLEYTVNVTTAGKYSYEAVVSSGADNSGFSLGLVEADGHVSNITSKITIPNGGSWDTYRTVTGNLGKKLQAGQQVIRVTIISPYCNIDKITLTCTEPEQGLDAVSQDSTPAAIYDLTGRRVSQMQPGKIYIVNGQKIRF